MNPTPVFPSPASASGAAAGSSAAAPRAAAASSSKTSRRMVDAPTRAFHWLLALSFIGAYLTADGERWRLVHVTLGYGMVLLLAFRIVWGLVGPRGARFSALWSKLKGLPQWLGGLKNKLLRHVKPGAIATNSIANQSINWTQGQNLGMALAIASLLLLIAPLLVSGLMLYNEWAGEWMEDVHEFFGDTMLTLVLAHVALVLGLSVWRKRNLVMPMISGRVAGPGPNLVKRNHLWLGAVLLAAMLALWGWQWQNAPRDAVGAVIEQMASGGSGSAQPGLGASPEAGGGNAQPGALTPAETRAHKRQSRKEQKHRDHDDD